MNRALMDYFNKQKRFNTLPINEGMVITDLGEDTLEITLPTTLELHGNPRKEIHGGVYMAVSDTTMGITCFCMGKEVTTLEISGNFVRKAMAGETIVAKAKIEHNGGRTMVLTNHIYNEAGKLLYTGKGTFFVLREFKLPEVED